tara:strand:+ start:1825 stop:2019 length:195 start_codon:yes stop_codon:yes gene_type:complete
MDFEAIFMIVFGTALWIFIFFLVSKTYWNFNQDGIDGIIISMLGFSCIAFSYWFSLYIFDSLFG